MNYPVLDANVHATQSGKWFDTDLNASLGALLEALDDAGVDRAFLTGLPGACNTPDVVDLASRSGGKLLPVGALIINQEDSKASVVTAVSEMRASQLVGVKLHPRLTEIDILDERVLSAVREINNWQEPLPVWLCTLMHRPGVLPLASSVESIVRLVGAAPRVPFILVHAGGPDLLRLATALRGSDNAWFDLSYLLTKFMGSSVEADLRFLLRVFEQRLIFGSDFPECDISEARSELLALVQDENPLAAPAVFGGNLKRAIRL